MKAGKPVGGMLAVILMLSHRLGVPRVTNECSESGPDKRLHTYFYNITYIPHLSEHLT